MTNKNKRKQKKAQQQAASKANSQKMVGEPDAALKSPAATTISNSSAPVRDE